MTLTASEIDQADGLKQEIDRADSESRLRYVETDGQNEDKTNHLFVDCPHGPTNSGIETDGARRGIDRAHH